jgi:hypothetical protein
MTDIHERIIARLEYWRTRWCMNLDQQQMDAADNVRRKCQRCDDTGTTHTILNSLLVCDCNASRKQWVMDTLNHRLEAASYAWATLPKEAQSITTFEDYTRRYLEQFPPITYTSSNCVTTGIRTNKSNEEKDKINDSIS